ncbi:MAG: hypothetical protein EBZ48_07155, partial [Proteobacteria bacterium]|nr:hypothetical protein [Pseudomonadota bacterium]
MLYSKSEGPGPGSPQPSADFDLESLRTLSIGRSAPAEIAVLHFGFKALCHAVIAHQALNVLESGRPGRDALCARFGILDAPLSFSLSGASACGVVTPGAVLQFSAHSDPALVAPLTAPRANGVQTGPTLPPDFARLEWNAADLEVRDKMGAALLFAQRLFGRAIDTYRKQTESGAFSHGGLDRYVSYLVEQMHLLCMGEARRTSLLQGEQFLLGLRGTSASPQPSSSDYKPVSPAWVNEISLPRDPRISGYHALVRSLARERGETPAIADDRKPDVPVAEQSDLELLRTLEVLRSKLSSLDRMARAEAQLDLRGWRGRFFSPIVARDLRITTNMAAEVQQEKRILEEVRGLFEIGDCQGALSKVEHLLKGGSPTRRGAIHFLRAEATALQRLIRAVSDAAAEELTRVPSMVWPDAVNPASLAEVLHRAFMRGADAEVFVDNGMIGATRMLIHPGQQF